MDALTCRPLGRPPVWVMRQAGRYLPEYRALKEKYSFLEMVRTPELAVEVTLQPLRRFPLDAAIVFSDILVIPEAMGQPYHFKDTGGIGMDYRLESASDIERLNPRAIPEGLAYVAETERRLRHELSDRTALLGFGGSPWTLAAYMVEGGSSTDWPRLIDLYRRQSSLFHDLMEKLVEALAVYFEMQAEAGVDAIQIFDSWAGICPPDEYEGMSLRWIRAIVERLDRRVPIILYAKGMAAQSTALAATGATCLGFDWTVDLRKSADQLPATTAVQGNLDPELLNGDHTTVAAETTALLDSMRGRPGHIFNLGHGIQPTARLESMAALVDTVVSFDS